MLKIAYFIVAVAFLVSCSQDAKDEHHSLTNTEVIELINLHSQAVNLPEGKEKQELAAKIHELTGSEQFFIGNQIYAFGEEHIYISKDKQACMVEIVSFARENSRIVDQSEISQNCHKYVKEVSRTYGYELKSE